MPVTTVDVADFDGVRRTINAQPSPGSTTAANSSPVTVASDDAIQGKLGALTETAPASDTASSGLNGRLQRIAQRLSSMIAQLPTTLGQTTKAGSLSVALASDTGTLVAGGNTVVAAVINTRPADTTAYATGDLVANSTTAGSVTPLAFTAARVNQGTGVIRRIRISTNHTGLAGTDVFRVHLFKTSPTVTNGDNGAFSANGITARSLGRTDVTLDHIYNDGAKGFASVDIVFDAASATQLIYGLIEVRNAYTPTSSEVFEVALEVLQD